MRRYTWIPFYKELAEKLMNYRNDRASLLSLIYDNRDPLYAKYLHDNKGEGDFLSDVDPFTVFGLFNRGIKSEKRVNSAKLFKKLFKMDSDAPTDFEGIPTLSYQRPYFFGYRNRRKKEDIGNLWNLFEKVVKGEDVEDTFNVVIKQYGININITMALFWIRPEDFLAFDSTNRGYLRQNYGIELPKSVPEYKQYMKMVNEIKDKMKNGTINEKSFVELSSNANNSGSGTVSNEGDSWHDFYVNLWKKRQNIVLQGAPGTGKTYCVPELVVRLCSPEFDSENATREELMAEYNQLKSDKRVMFTTFHQSMDYEDWLEGLRPVVENNQVTYEIEPGIFKKLCDEADKPFSTKKDIDEDSKTLIENTKPYVIVIDEMNRGNVAKIFGELITLLEPDKRKGQKNAESVIPPYSKKQFYIPSNVYLIATMNTADRSLGAIDYAIRRRFAFVTVKPIELEEGHFNAELFHKVSELFVANYDEYVESGFNDGIKLIPAETLCEEYRPEDVWIGHSYFIMEDDSDVKNRLQFEIIPLLEEYVRDGVLTNEAQETIDELYPYLHLNDTHTTSRTALRRHLSVL